MSQKLTSGMTAPSIDILDVFGERIQLSQYIGKPILLSFLRNGACALCNLRVHEMIQQYPKWREHSLVVLAIFESPTESVRTHVAKQDTPFSLIADPQAQLYDLYGVESSEAKVKATMNNPDLAQRVEAAAAIGYPLTPEAGSNFFRLPAEFLIDQNGCIHTAFYAERIGEHLDVKIISTALLDLALPMN